VALRSPRARGLALRAALVVTAAALSGVVALLIRDARQAQIDAHTSTERFDPAAPGGREPPPPGASVDPAATRAPGGPPEGAAAAPSTPPADPITALLADTSLRGTQVDGGFHLRADGHLLPHPDTLRLFDYLLSLEGELSDEAIADLLADAIDSRLEPPADADAHALLADYMRYREAGHALGEQVDEAEPLRARAERIRDLRREVFGDEAAELLFGAQERADDLAFARRDVLTDPDLTPAERAEALDQIDQAAPPAERAARQAASAPIDAMAAEADLRAQGATDAEVHADRVARFGADGAARLKALDARRADLDAKLDAYLARRARLGDPAALEAWATQEYGATLARRLRARAAMRDAAGR
jgi:lipase chaperone LimK